MMPAAPAAIALLILSTNVQVPRLINTNLPLTCAAFTNGVQASAEVAVAPSGPGPATPTPSFATTMVLVKVIVTSGVEAPCTGYPPARAGGARTVKVTGKLEKIEHAPS